MIKIIATGVAKFILKKIGLMEIVSLKRDAIRYCGWEHSAKKMASIDAKGNAIPWLTYPTIDLLSNRIHEKMRVFEYGCGNSTLWWAIHVRDVYSVEHNLEWFDKIKKTIPKNVNLKYIRLDYGGNYCNAISEHGLFDIIVIDGRDRVNCLKISIKSLAEDGILILDNSDREEYKEGVNFLLDNGFKQLPLRGLAPIVTYISETSIFYRNFNCLNL